MNKESSLDIGVDEDAVLHALNSTDGDAASVAEAARATTVDEPAAA